MIQTKRQQDTDLTRLIYPNLSGPFVQKPFFVVFYQTHYHTFPDAPVSRRKTSRCPPGSLPQTRTSIPDYAYSHRIDHMDFVCSARDCSPPVGFGPAPRGHPRAGCAPPLRTSLIYPNLIPLRKLPQNLSK